MSSRVVQRLVALLLPVRYYPPRLAFLLDGPWRRLLITPDSHADRLQVRPDARVLEVGTGPGYLSVAVARRTPRGALVAVDVQRPMLERARAKVTAAGLTNVAFVRADALRLPFADASFDTAYLVTVLGELPDADVALRELFRVLRPGGLLSITEQLPDPDFTRFSGVRRRCERHGFSLAERFGRSWNYTANFTRP